MSAWSPWETKKLDVAAKAVALKKGTGENVGKGGLTRKQQKELALPWLQDWWEGGGWSPFDRSNTMFVACNMALHLIQQGTRVNLKLKKYEGQYEAFLFYQVTNPRENVVVVNVFGGISLNDARAVEGKIAISKLARTRELGAKEFRQSMQEIYDRCEREKKAGSEARELRRHAIRLPLRRCFGEGAARRCRIDWTTVYRRMVAFAVSTGWSDSADVARISDNWRPPKKPDWAPNDTPWSQSDFLPRHKDLFGLTDEDATLAYFIGGAAAALDADYAKTRRHAEEMRLKFYFTNWFNTEDSVAVLLAMNNLGYLLGDAVTSSAVAEYQKRYPLSAMERSDGVTGSTELIRCNYIGDNAASDRDKANADAVRKAQELERERRDAYLATLPTKYGLIPIYDCPPAMLERGVGIRRGKVMVFYNEVEEVILHWMTIDQIAINGIVQANPSLFSQGFHRAFAADVVHDVREMQEEALSAPEKALANTNFRISSGSGNKAGKLDISVDELMEMLPPCIKGMLNRAARDNRSLKHNERKPLARFLVALGFPYSVYHTIAFPLWQAQCKATNQKDDSERRFLSDWNGKNMWDGKYANLSCMNVMNLTIETAGATEKCTCPFVDAAKLLNRTFTSLCAGNWERDHPGNNNAFPKGLYFPSQHVYASVKAKRRRKKITIESEPQE